MAYYAPTSPTGWSIYGQSAYAQYGSSIPPAQPSSLPPPTGPGSLPPQGGSAFSPGATSVVGASSVVGGGSIMSGGKSHDPSDNFNDSPGLPQWSGSNVRPLEASMVSELRKFNISDACGNSVTQGVKLLNDLNEAWQNDYAIIFSKQSHTWWLLAREGAALGLAEAVEAHKKITPAQTAKRAKDSKHSKESRKAYPLEKRLMTKIVGQRQAILAVSQQIRRKENGWHSNEHPLVCREFHRDFPQPFSRFTSGVSLFGQFRYWEDRVGKTSCLLYARGR